MDELERKALLILRRLLDEDDDARPSSVHAFCDGDPALTARVRTLLHHVDAVIDQDADTGDTSHGKRTSDDPLLGVRLGPFRVIERIGKGGMGVVYRGERLDADFRQTVAIKLIRRGFDFDDVQARFLRERRILAQLNHPNLARFIDGGVATDGRPWFALEYVQGEAIHRWCDRRRLSIRGRIELLVQVCAAVRYAHTQLVVHRDLKPGNILVDESGTVRLLDFGLARLLTGDGGNAATLATAFGNAALTPEYAAPEQFADNIGGVASDVYALGVIAYELVSGVLPYDLDRADPALAQAIVRDTPPQALVQAITRRRPPSSDQAATRNLTADTSPSPVFGDEPVRNTALREGEGNVEQRLRARSVSLAGYRQAVRGDLSRIVETALAKEPERRYATVEALADDLRRWLDGAPVRVAGNRFGYRLGKFVRRNRVAVGIGLVGALTLAAFSGYHLATLNTQLAQTRAERNRAEASLDFLQKLLSSPNPQFGAGANVTLGEFLVDAVATVATDTSLDAATRDELGLTLAGSLRGVGRYDEMLEFARRLAASPAQGSDGLRRRVQAGTLVGETLVLKGEYEAGLAELEETASFARIHGVDDPLTIATLLARRSIANNHLTRWDESTRLIDRALVVGEPIREQHPADYATWLSLASIPRAYPRLDLPAAEALLQRSLAFLEAHGLANSGQYAVTQGDLADTLVYQERFEEAEPLLLDVIARMIGHYGENHRQTSFRLHGIALLYYRWNRLDEARRWQDRATQSMRAALGDSHPFLAWTLSHSADMAFYAGQIDRAVADSQAAAAVAGEQDRERVGARAQVIAAAADCRDAGKREAAITDLLRRIDGLDDALNPDAFRLRAATSDCLLLASRPDAAQAVIEPFATGLEAGAKVARNDYYHPVIARIRARQRPRW